MFKKNKKFEIRWAEELGEEDCPYLVRWCIISFGYSIRLHHWIQSDDDRNFHDHSWNFISVILRGGYTDISPEGSDKVLQGSIRCRKATHRHSVKVNQGGCWSLMLTGPPIRPWGFWIGDRFQKPRNYFRRWGHHEYPCN